ncbi:MAG TPA: RNA-dependent DNA polymerase [Anaerolineaceae bacterium]|jgi:retron-type reverse transcriptase|nr:RNA-dependent DNA polymerase [Anaerolineaceae bacterium]
MKTYKNLYPQITAFENLYTAYKRAARGKRRKQAVAEFEMNLEENLFELQEQLINQTYTPSPYRNFHIFDPKPRLISAAPFRDRVVHHALCQVLEPIYEPRFIYDTYACRRGKGTHAAIRRAQQYARQFPYVLQCDLREFFPSIDHAVLTSRFTRLLRDQRVLWLIEQILKGGAGIHQEHHEPFYFPGDDLLSAVRPRGLPIGNLTSQFWANVYLDPLDQFVKRELKCAGYVRYVDDFLLFAQDKSRLHEYRRAVIHFLVSLRQCLHEERAVVFPTRTGIPFLGWRIYPDHLRLKRRNGVAFQRRFARMRKLLLSRQISIQRLQSAINGWIAHVAHGQTWGLRRALLSQVPIRGGL